MDLEKQIHIITPDQKSSRLNTNRLNQATKSSHIEASERTSDNNWTLRFTRMIILMLALAAISACSDSDEAEKTKNFSNNSDSQNDNGSNIDCSMEECSDAVYDDAFEQTVQELGLDPNDPNKMIALLSDPEGYRLIFAGLVEKLFPSKILEHSLQTREQSLTPCGEEDLLSCYCDSVSYCGPGIDDDNNDGEFDIDVPSDSAIHPGTCLNQICFNHDRCYQNIADQCGMNVGLKCSWSEVTKACDEGMLELEGLCTGIEEKGDWARGPVWYLAGKKNWFSYNVRFVDFSTGGATRTIFEKCFDDFNGCQEGVEFRIGRNICEEDQDNMNSENIHFIQVSAGDGHSCGVKSNGEIECWGLCDSGRCNTPTGHFIQVSTGEFHTCGILSTGEALCWGNSEGKNPPPQNYTQIEAATFYSCGLTTDQHISCWGAWEFNDLILEGSYSQISLPPNSSHLCAIDLEQNLFCWGTDSSRNPIERPSVGGLIQISEGNSHGCGIKNDESIECWNWNEETHPLPEGEFSQISVGNRHLCGLKTNGTIVCIGTSYYGNPFPQAPEGVFSQISTGTYHSCAVKTDGTINCWGLNDQGQSNPPDVQNQNEEDAMMPSIEITTPSENTTWTTGTTEIIRWSTTNITGPVDIYLYWGLDGNRPVVWSATNDGTYPWTIPSELSTRNDYRLRINSIEKPEFFDFVDFTIEDGN